MSRGHIALVLVGYYFVALAFAVLLHFLEPFSSWNARSLGEAVGAAISLFLLSGLIPLIVWACWRFRAVDAKPILIAWAILGVIIGALSFQGSQMDWEEKRNQPPPSIEHPGKDRDEFVDGAKATCVAGQLKSPVNQETGITEKQIQSFCDCTAKLIANSISAEELKIMMQTGEMPSSARVKATESGQKCALPLRVN